MVHIMRVKKIVPCVVVVRTTKKIVGPPDALSWWSGGPLLIKVCVKPCNCVFMLKYSHIQLEKLFN